MNSKPIWVSISAITIAFLIVVLSLNHSLKESDERVNGLELRFRNSKIEQTSVAKEWEEKTIKLECRFSTEDTHYGSGIIFLDSDNDLRIITNKHLFVDSKSNPAKNCEIKFSGSNNGYVIVPEKVAFAPKGEDIVSFTFKEQDGQQGDQSKFKKIAIRESNLCEDKNVLLGDNVFIFGYPAVGSQNSVVVTSGVMAGKYNEYYITDAKINEGNSGGAAVLVKDNCYFGIPTISLSKTLFLSFFSPFQGVSEPLAGILPSSFIKELKE